ncbi:MAG: MFS transporter [Bacilli bacterium]|jgi:sugar (glycoside-pentoside-hexuronide) transporter
MTNLKKTFSGDKVPLLTKIVYPFSGIGRDMAYTLVSLFLMTYVQFTLGSEGNYEAKMLAIIIIMFVARLWDGINDPMIGTLIENTHFKMGKYKPWILIGAVSNSIVLALMFSIRVHGWWFVLLFAIFYLLWGITFTFNDIAYWSMLPSLSKEEKTRNQLTTLVAVAASIGAFTVGGVVPIIFPGAAISRFRYIGIVVAAIFLLCQLLMVFTCKERAREEVKSEKITLKEMFQVLYRNKQLWYIMIVIVIYYLGGALLNGFGLNYFYFAYGYEKGGGNMLFFTVAYALGTIIAQATYPLFANKFKRSQILATTFIIVIVGHLLIFTYGMLHALGITAAPNIYAFSAIGLLIFAAEGLFYMALIIMATNTIEYNEWKTGERKESIIFSARPFAAKISSSFQTIILYIVLLAGGIYSITNQISQVEIAAELEGLTKAETYAQAQAAIDGAANLQGVLIALLVGMALLPIVLFICAYILLKKKYKIDEVAYNKMVEDIKNGNVGPHNNLDDIVGKPKKKKQLETVQK